MIYIFAAMAVYSLALVAVTHANRHANVTLVALIFNLLSISVPAILFLTAKSGDKVSTKSGIIAAVIGGIFISLFTLFLGKSYEQNNVAIVSPIVFGGTIILTSIAGYFLFKEKILPLQGAGLALVAAGLALVVYSQIKA